MGPRRDLVVVAQAYAARGLPVIFLTPATAPIAKPGKAPLFTGWLRDGFVRPEDVPEEYARAQAECERRGYPDGPNLGIRTGYVDCAPLSLIVVDADGAEGIAWTELNLPPTPWRVRTGREDGGRHLYYVEPSAPVRSRDNALRGNPRGVDVKGASGYVVAPGSTHKSGGRYVEDPPWDLGATPPVFDPAWFAHQQPDLPRTPPARVQRQPDRRAIPRAAAYGRAAVAGMVAVVASAPEKTRNTTLNVEACKLGSLAAAGVVEDEGEAVNAMARAAEHSGLDAGEIVATLESGLAAGRKSPRQVPDFADGRFSTFYAQVPMDVITNTEISDGAIRLYFYLSARDVAGNGLYESVPTIAGVFRKSKRTVTAWITELAAAEMVFEMPEPISSKNKTHRRLFCRYAVRDGKPVDRGEELHRLTTLKKTSPLKETSPNRDRSLPGGGSSSDPDPDQWTSSGRSRGGE